MCTHTAAFSQSQQSSGQTDRHKIIIVIMMAITLTVQLVFLHSIVFHVNAPYPCILFLITIFIIFSSCYAYTSLLPFPFVYSPSYTLKQKKRFRAEKMSNVRALFVFFSCWWFSLMILLITISSLLFFSSITPTSFKCFATTTFRKLDVRFLSFSLHRRLVFSFFLHNSTLSLFNRNFKSKENEAVWNQMLCD